jgi:hypothetical protein
MRSTTTIYHHDGTIMHKNNEIQYAKECKPKLTLDQGLNILESVLMLVDKSVTDSNIYQTHIALANKIIYKVLTKIDKALDTCC